LSRLAIKKISLTFNDLTQEQSDEMEAELDMATEDGFWPIHANFNIILGKGLETTVEIECAGGLSLEELDTFIKVVNEVSP
jgi:predicted methyltransferase